MTFSWGETTWGEMDLGRNDRNYLWGGGKTEFQEIRKIYRGSRNLNWELEEGVGEALTSEHQRPKLAGGLEIFVKFLFYVFFG